MRRLRRARTSAAARARQLRPFTLAALTAMAFIACRGSSAPRADEAEGGGSFTVQTLTLEGSTDEPSHVEVSGLADADGQDDVGWRATFALDDGPAPGSLPRDTGETRTYGLDVRSTRLGDGQVMGKRVTVTLLGSSPGSPDEDAAQPAQGVGAGAAPTARTSVEVGEGLACRAADGERPAVLLALLLLGLLGRRARTRDRSAPQRL